MYSMHNLWVLKHSQIPFLLVSCRPMKTKVQIIQHLNVTDQLVYARTSRCSYIVSQISQQSFVNYAGLIKSFFPTLEVQLVHDVQLQTGFLLTGRPVHSMFMGVRDDSAKTLDLCVQHTHLNIIEQMVLQSGYRLFQTRHSHNRCEDDEKHTTELLLSFNDSLKTILRTSNTYVCDTTKVRIRECQGPPIETILLSNTSQLFIYLLYQHTRS